MVLDCYEKKDFAGIPFCDLSKAFDRVSHKILIKILEHYNINTFSAAGPPAGPTRHGLGAGGSRADYRASHCVGTLQQLASGSCRSWNVLRSRLAATLRGPPATPSCYYLQWIIQSLDRLETPQKLPASNDPVQRAVDDVSDEESDDGSSVNDADEDPDIYTTAPQWTIATSGMRPI
ncbi:hypothetical protein J6590_090017 [Homalodisca vitripennis]|nr:hypothetical protein J6590_090017 [Homalodisca vitripennis]